MRNDVTEAEIIKERTDYRKARADADPDNKQVQFALSAQKGKLGESIFAYSFFQFNGFHYTNVSGDKLDHDFLCQDDNKTYEVKANYNDDSFVWIETKSQTDNDGWGYTCDADYLVFVSIDSGECLIFDWQKIKPLVPAFHKKHKEINNKQTHGVYGDNWTSRAIRVPYQSIRQFLVMQAGLGFMPKSFPVIREESFIDKIKRFNRKLENMKKEA